MLQKTNHYSLVQQPSSKYSRQITVSSGESQFFAEAIFKHFEEQNMKLDDLVDVGYAGANVKTGKFGWVIRFMERELGRPL